MRLPLLQYVRNNFMGFLNCLLSPPLSHLKNDVFFCKFTFLLFIPSFLCPKKTNIQLLLLFRLIWLCCS